MTGERPGSAGVGGEGMAMKAIVYERNGDASVLQQVERPIPAPGPGEVLVRMAVSG